MLFCMLSQTMPHIGTLGFNHQKLIDALALINGNDVYEFMASSLKVEKSIYVSHIYPSPDLIFQITNKISKSPEHHLATSDMKSDFIFFVCIKNHHQQAV